MRYMFGKNKRKRSRYFFVGIGVLFVFFALVPHARVYAAEGPFSSIMGDMLLNLLPNILTKGTQVIAGLFGGLVGKAGSMVIWFGSKYEYVDHFAVELGWNIVRDVANMFFILVLVAIAFGTIVGSEQFGWKTRLPHLIIAAFVVNFSKIILGFLIDITQVITLTFFSALEQGGAAFTDIFQLDKISQLDGTADPWSLLAASVLGSIIAIYLACLMFYIAIRLAKRYFILIMCIIMSPMAFLARAVPYGDTYYKKWWDLFLKELLFGPFVAFFLWLVVVTISSGALDPVAELKGATGINSLLGTEVAFAAATKAEGISFLNFIMGTSIFVITGVMMADMMVGGVMGGAAKLLGKGARMGGRLAMKGAKMARKPLGAGARKIGSSFRNVGGAAGNLAAKVTGGAAGVATAAVGGAGKFIAKDFKQTRADVAGAMGKGKLGKIMNTDVGTPVVKGVKEAAQPWVQGVGDAAKGLYGEAKGIGSTAVDRAKSVYAGAKDVTGAVAASPVGQAAKRGAEVGGNVAGAVGGAFDATVEGAKAAPGAVRRRLAAAGVVGSGREKDIERAAAKAEVDMAELDKPKFNGRSAKTFARGYSTETGENNMATDKTKYTSELHEVAATGKLGGKKVAVEKQQAAMLRHARVGDISDLKNSGDVDKFTSAGSRGSSAIADEAKEILERRDKGLRRPGKTTPGSEGAPVPLGRAPEPPPPATDTKPEKSKEEKSGWLDKLLSILGMSKEEASEDGAIDARVQNLKIDDPEAFARLEAAAQEMDAVDVESDDDMSAMREAVLGDEEVGGTKLLDDEGESAETLPGEKPIPSSEGAPVPPGGAPVGDTGADESGGAAENAKVIALLQGILSAVGGDGSETPSDGDIDAHMADMQENDPEQYAQIKESLGGTDPAEAMKAFAGAGGTVADESSGGEGDAEESTPPEPEEKPKTATPEESLMKGLKDDLFGASGSAGGDTGAVSKALNDFVRLFSIGNTKQLGALRALINSKPGGSAAAVKYIAHGDKNVDAGIINAIEAVKSSAKGQPKAA